LLGEVYGLRQEQPRLGARKLLVKLEGFIREHKLSIGRDAFFELLRENGLLVRRIRRRGPATTMSRHRFKKYPDSIKGLVTDRPQQVWVSDITYIKVGKGFAYLSLVTDAYSRKIMGYHLDAGLTTAGPIAALQMAIGKIDTTLVKEEAPLIHHSDRGTQYCSAAYVKLLEDNDIGISMTQGSDPRDNAIAERVNGILKQELLPEQHNGIRQARKAVAAAIEVYNHHRPHSSLDMLTPEQAHARSGHIRRRWKSYYRTNVQGKEAMMSS
jgi:putative transposase